MIDTRKGKKPKKKGGAMFREMRTEKRRKKMKERKGEKQKQENGNDKGRR